MKCPTWPTVPPTPFPVLSWAAHKLHVIIAYNVDKLINQDLKSTNHTLGPSATQCGPPHLGSDTEVSALYASRAPPSQFLLVFLAPTGVGGPPLGGGRVTDFRHIRILCKLCKKLWVCNSLCGWVCVGGTWCRRGLCQAVGYDLK